METLVLGLGNPILSDDGVGPSVAEALRGTFDRKGVSVQEASVAGLGLLDLLAGYEKAIIIDAIQTVDGKAGQVYRLGMEALEYTRHTASPHDVNLATALDLGRKVGMALPRQIVIFAVEVADASTFSEECTHDVKRAVPTVVELVAREIKGDNDAYLDDGSKHPSGGAERGTEA